MIDLEEIDEMMDKIRFESFSDNVEENIDRGLILSYLYELKKWRENPFMMIKRHCESVRRCEQCDYHDSCIQTWESPTPEEWKL